MPDAAPPLHSPARDGLERRRPLAAICSALISAAWIGVCAASPEFIWRGAQLARAHLDLAELGTAIPIGFVLAFFVEPLLEKLRAGLHGHHPAATGAPGRGGTIFAAASGLLFALCALCVHDAMKALVSAHGAVRPGSYPGIRGAAPAVALTLGWALAPFMVTLTWAAAHRLSLCVPLALFALVAPLMSGIAFGWSRADILTTAVPCAAILLLGAYRLRGNAVPRGLRRTVIEVAVVWLLLAGLTDLTLDATGLKRWSLYSPAAFWMDVRFYLGWIAGLTLVPGDIFSRAVSDPRTVVIPRPLPGMSA
ncbi:hypothetical protein [Rhizosaccharibacter radicis]|uniref:Uncharacterized protein n=1 Tax=Rhizosaccharibacter radicis TaxID=2782605 RepID=A0ABT1VVJ2_9PROT|nr:hypothetical protein [Acetobacteraceae bacterium KSS12]